MILIIYSRGYLFIERRETKNNDKNTPRRKRRRKGYNNQLFSSDHFDINIYLLEDSVYFISLGK